MAYYKTRRNFKPHNLNNTTININKEHKVEGLHSVTITRDEDEVTVVKSNDGLAVFAENPSLSGTIVLEVLEASPTTDYLWARYNSQASFGISVLDAAVPALNGSGAQCRVMKPTEVVRDNEPKMQEWTLICTYLDIAGGSYSQVSP